jgi:hypothetical protein
VIGAHIVLLFPVATATWEAIVDVDAIVEAVKAEIARLNLVVSLLTGGVHVERTVDGRTKAGRTGKPIASRRKMSAAGRARIVAAQKARWAKIRATKK